MTGPGERSPDPGAAGAPDGARPERGLGNPLRSEAAAFRWLLAVAAVCALLVAVTLLIRAF